MDINMHMYMHIDMDIDTNPNADTYMSKKLWFSTNFFKALPGSA
jgi:hypothetical protein